MADAYFVWMGWTSGQAVVRMRAWLSRW
ncbi:MAG: hypothetical protein QOE61_3661, partial [Micromonosporaceae bacterium]|nr:hypothetical protein [Micromonosporaceae bacterium]